MKYPDRPSRLRSVGNQPEPKLIASSVSQNAASSSRVPVVRWASGSGAGMWASSGNVPM